MDAPPDATPDFGSPPRAPILAVGAVATDEAGRLLVIRRGRRPGRGQWTLPGGRVESGETLTTAVERELAEETGLRGLAGDVVGVFEIVRPELHLVSVDHHVDILDGQLQAGDDATDVAWMTRAQLVAAPTTIGLLEFLDDHDVPLA